VKSDEHGQAVHVVIDREPRPEFPHTCHRIGACDPFVSDTENVLLHRQSRVESSSGGTKAYVIDGERIPYFFDGRNRTRALFFKYVRGITDRWDVKAQLPFFNIAFDDIADERTSNGLGDLRIESRYNLVRVPLVLTVGGAIKLPTGEFVNDAEIVPVGEGQYDFDVFVEVGRALWPVRGYVTGKIGYRFRTKNQEIDIDFGDELIWRVEGGYQFGTRIYSKIVLRGLHGFESTSFGLSIDSLRRRVIYLEPGARFTLAASRTIEVTVPISRSRGATGRQCPFSTSISLRPSEPSYLASET
jgi:hypothetical protein